MTSKVSTAWLMCETRLRLFTSARPGRCSHCGFFKIFPICGISFLAAGMTRGSFAEHRAIARVERDVQRKRAVAVVFKTVTLKPSGRQWQHRIEPIQRLDSSLFIDAKHRRMLG